MQFVKRVEELFLGALLVADDLDVVDEQDVGRAVAMAELRHPFQADASDHLVGEPFAEV